MPELIASAVEECLRCESPNQLGNRLVVERVYIRGVTYEPGTYLTLCIGAANRDAATNSRIRTSSTSGAGPTVALRSLPAGTPVPGCPWRDWRRRSRFPGSSNAFPKCDCQGRPYVAGERDFAGISRCLHR